MKKTFLSLLLLILTVVTASAQDVKKLSGSLLWKVSGKDLAQPSYILGTHHLLNSTFSDSIAGLKTALNNTNQVVGELLIDDKPALQAQIQQAALMPAGETYKDLLSTTEYEQLDNGLKAIFTVGLDQFGQLKPGMLNMLLAITLYAKQHPEFNPMAHQGIDEYVQIYAKENGKSVLGLETANDQIKALFDSEPMKDQAVALVCAINNSERNIEAMEEAGVYYRAGNLYQMYEMAFNDPKDPCPTSQRHQIALLKNRNDNWLQQLPEIMKSKPSLVAVGALHLAGEEGLLYQLQKMGYKVEEVK